MTKKCTTSTVYGYLSAVAYNYRIQGLPSISEHPSVGMYMKGLKRRNIAVPVKQAKPMTPEVLGALRTLLKDPTLVIWRTIWCLHVEFELMLRFDDLKRLKVMSK